MRTQPRRTPAPALPARPAALLRPSLTRRSALRAGLLGAAVLTLAACSQKTDADYRVPDESASAGLTASGNPIVTTPITVTATGSRAALSVPYDQMELTRQWARDTNVQVRWDMLTEDVYADKKNLLLASGDLPDILWNTGLSDAEIERIRRSTRAIADGVGVRGLINIQFALMSDTLYVIEANPRASRTVPFVSKATGVQLAKAAALLMAGQSIASLRAAGLLPQEDAAVTDPYDPIAVKEAVLPFRRFRTPTGRIVDTVLGPEMRSTGEVMGYDVDFPRAFAKSQVSAYGGLPAEGTLFVSVADRDKRAIILPVARLAELGFTVLATTGTAQVLRRNGIPATPVRKVSQGRGAHGEQTIVELIESGAVDMVVNTPKGQGARADGYSIRAATTSAGRPIITTVQELQAAVQALEAQLRGPFHVRSLQEHGADRISRRESAARREARA